MDLRWTVNASQFNVFGFRITSPSFGKSSSCINSRQNGRNPACGIDKRHMNPDRDRNKKLGGKSSQMVYKRSNPLSLVSIDQTDFNGDHLWVLPRFWIRFTNIFIVYWSNIEFTENSRRTYVIPYFSNKISDFNRQSQYSSLREFDRISHNHPQNHDARIFIIYG